MDQHFLSRLFGKHKPKGEGETPKGWSEDLRVELPNADAYFCRGLRRSGGDLDGCIADLTKAIELEPHFAVAYFNRGNAKQAKGDLDGALADYAKAIELKPDFPLAFYNRGEAKYSKGDFDGAIADYTKAIELKPDIDNAYCKRANAKQVKGDLDGALADYTEAVDLRPDDVSAYHNRGKAKQAQGDLDGALADYTKAVELKPDFAVLAVVYGNRGLARKAQGDLDGAIADRTKAIELSAIADYTKAIGPLKCPTCGTNYRLGDDATMVTSQDVTNAFQRSGATIIGRGGAIAGEVWPPVATQTQPALIGRKRNLGHLTEAEVLENVTGLLENVSRIRETIQKGSKAFWYCEKCRHNEQPHAFPSDF